MSKFKIGDKCIVKKEFVSSVCGDFSNCYQKDKKCYIIITNDNGSCYSYDIYDSKNNKISYCTCFTDEHLDLYNNITNMNIKEQFLLAITAEPQKSFRKTGITNGDDLLTEDGQKVFLSWLLKQNQDQFKKEVVDPILEDMEKEKE